MEVSGQLHAPVALPPGKESPVPRAGLDAVTEIKKKSHHRAHLELNPMHSSTLNPPEDGCFMNETNTVP